MKSESLKGRATYTLYAESREMGRGDIERGDSEKDAFLSKAVVVHKGPNR